MKVEPNIYDIVDQLNNQTYTYESPVYAVDNTASDEAKVVPYGIRYYYTHDPNDLSQIGLYDRAKRFVYRTTNPDGTPSENMVSR